MSFTRCSVECSESNFEYDTNCNAIMRVNCSILNYIAHYSAFFAPSPAVYTRGHPYKLFKKHRTIRSRQTFFSERVINVWNYLPYDIVCFNSLNAFNGVLNV